MPSGGPAATSSSAPKAATAIEKRWSADAASKEGTSFVAVTGAVISRGRGGSSVGGAVVGSLAGRRPSPGGSVVGSEAGAATDTGGCATAFLAWFGPLGVAAIYYATFARGHVHDPVLWHAASALISASILLHGVTAGPLNRWLSVNVLNPR